MKRVPGKKTDKVKIFDNINENDFVNLVGDILFSQFNHKDVKVMDGPGDGKRDIYSINKHGEECLTQCKFHRDTGITVGSRETDELIMGLSKFGYKFGKFATSGKISPQAMRESKDNFPNFDLEYLDGSEIADYVISDALLSHIWLNNGDIVNGLRKIIIPIIFRDLRKNTSIETDDFKLEKNCDNLFYKTVSHYCSKSDFYPYEPPSTRNYNEGWGGYLKCIKVDFTGDLNLHLFNNYIDLIVNDVKRYFIEKNTYDLVAIRIGQAYFCDICNEGLLSNIKLPFSPITFIFDRNKKEIFSEYNWHIVNLESWKLPERIHMSQLSYFIFFNEDINVCLSQNYYASATEEDRDRFKESEQFEWIMWNNSLFLYGKNDKLKKFIEISKFNPNEIYLFGKDSCVCGWLHPTPIIRPVINEDIELYEAKIIDKNFKDYTEKIYDVARKYEIEKIDSKKAYHIACMNDKNPINNINNCYYRTVDYYDSFNQIPSPLVVKNREFNYEIVWLINFNYSKREEIEQKSSKIIEQIEKITYNYKTNCIIDDEAKTGFYIYLTISISYDSYFDSGTIINNHQVELNNIITIIEKNIYKIHKDFIRFTKQYWLNEYGVIL